MEKRIQKSFCTLLNSKFNDSLLMGFVNNVFSVERFMTFGVEQKVDMVVVTEQHEFMISFY